MLQEVDGAEQGWVCQMSVPRYKSLRVHIITPHNPRLATHLPLLQQMERPLRCCDFRGHHVPADLVGSPHCGRNHPGQRGLCQL